MNAKERAPLGFGAELEELDAGSWENQGERKRPRPDPANVREAAAKAGFSSREPRSVDEAARPAPKPRRRRTGRNAQFNIKAKPETIQAFCEIADAKGWGLGETFEIATALLLKQHGK
jgi:hypothetical protein